MLCPRLRQPHALRPLLSVTQQSYAQRCGFPRLSKATQTVAVLSCNTGSPGVPGSLTKDVNTYCQHFGYPVPRLDAVSVDGAASAYRGNPEGADQEDALDVQQIIGMTGGMVNVRVYYVRNTEQGMADGLVAVAQDNLACALSDSWGLAEPRWSAPGRGGIDYAAGRLLNLGIPCWAASGDGSSSDGFAGDNGDYPACSPGFLACGGISLASGSPVAWDKGGGGYSKVYPLLAWQTILGADGLAPAYRGEPDVAGNADPNSGFPICCGGQWYTVGGTSAVAPTMAAFVASVVSITGKRIVNLAPWLYQNRALFTDVVTGRNGAYAARAGWDECTGLGELNVRVFAALIGQQTPAPPTPPVNAAPVFTSMKLSDAAGNVLSYNLTAA